MRWYFEPPFLPLQTAALALLAVGAAVWLYVRWELRRRSGHRSLVVLRGLVVALLALILLNPVVRAAAPVARVKAPFLILLDTSRSMTTPDAEQDASSGARLTRWNAARQAVLRNTNLLEALSRRYDVRFYGFDDRAVARTPESLRQQAEPAGSHTDIGDAITQAVNGSRPVSSANAVHGGMLLVSDGRDNGTASPVEAAHVARSLGFPVYTLCLGQETKARDLQVVARRPQTFAAPGQTVDLAAEIRDTGIPHANVRVDLLREGRRVASQNLFVTPGRQEVRFPVVEKQKGFVRYGIACAPLPDETDTTNNRANIFLSVLDTRMRVLLLEGRPTWDAKFLARTLRSDPTVTLDSIYQLTDVKPFALRGSSDTPVLNVPHTVADFSHYDVLILGKGYESFFDAPSTVALKQWISDKGGNLVFLRGRPDENSAALADLEPVTYTNEEIDALRMRLTDAGRSHPGFTFDTGEDAQTVVEKLPSLISATRVQGEKALAVVLARAEGSEETDENDTQEMAMLAYQRYGQGKVLAVVGQGLWRWAFLPPDLTRYGQVYTEFWTQTLRWLISESDFLPGQRIALHTDRTSYSTTDTVRLLGYVRGSRPAALPPIHLTLPDGKTATFQPTAGDGKTADFTASYRPLRPGEYVASISLPGGTAKTLPALATFTVYSGQDEDTNRSADPALMRQIAAAGGGQTLHPQDVDSLPESLRAAEEATIQTKEPQTLWDRAWVLATLLGLLTLEWLFRRRAGLA
ncbi:MAG TPA: hypothetical protein VFA07_09220 [Chthonomonadaceae bacterium]|nr:hypothetical protein [Chthonomonadaceae bacterium]